MYVKIFLHNHRKCQKAHSGIVSGRKAPGKPGLWLVAYTKNGRNFPFLWKIPSVFTSFTYQGQDAVSTSSAMFRE